MSVWSNCMRFVHHMRPPQQRPATHSILDQTRQTHELLLFCGAAVVCSQTTGQTRSDTSCTTPEWTLFYSANVYMNERSLGMFDAQIHKSHWLTGLHCVPCAHPINDLTQSRTFHTAESDYYFIYIQFWGKEVREEVVFADATKQLVPLLSQSHQRHTHTHTQTHVPDTFHRHISRICKLIEHFEVTPAALCAIYDNLFNVENYSIFVAPWPLDDRKQKATCETSERERSLFTK